MFQGSLDSETVVREAVEYALRNGAATITRAGARPDVAETLVRDYLRAAGQDELFELEKMTDGGLRLILRTPSRNGAD
jgi:hypothetical protein